MSDPGTPTLERMVADYGGLIRRVVGRVCGARAALVGDDVEQEVRIALWKRLRSEQPIERPASYLYRAAVREALRAIRRQNASPIEPVEDLELAAGEGTSPLASVESRELRERIESALAGMLPERRRAVRAHLAGFEVTEIMEMTGWPYNRARNLVARGMADLRARLREEDR